MADYSQTGVSLSLRGLSQRRRARVMLAIITGKVRKKSRRRKYRELDVDVEVNVNSRSELIPSIELDERRMGISDRRSVATKKKLYRDFDQPTPRKWILTPYHPLMTFAQHLNGTCLVIPQGYKDASKEACNCMAAITQYQLGSELSPYHPARLPHILEDSSPSRHSGPPTPSSTGIATSTVTQSQNGDQSITQQSANYSLNRKQKSTISALPIAQKISIHPAQSSKIIEQVVINPEEMLSQGFSALCRWNTGQARTLPNRNTLDWHFNAAEWFRIGKHRTLEEAIYSLNNGFSCFHLPQRHDDYESFLEKFKTIEAECIQRVSTWLNKRICRKREWAECFELDVSLMPIQSSYHWLKEAEQLRVMALITITEVIHISYNITDSGQNTKEENNRLDWAIEGGEATAETIEEIEAQYQIEKEMMSLLVESSSPSETAREHWKDWDRLREFCRMLREPFVPNGRRALWELILEYQYGLPIDVILDPALL